MRYMREILTFNNNNHLLPQMENYLLFGSTKILGIPCIVLYNVVFT